MRLNPTWRQMLYSDLLLLGGLGLLALGLGLGSNPWRPHPLPTSWPSPHSSALSPEARILPAAPHAEVKEIAEGRLPGIIIDARTPLFYRLGHIPRALNLPRQSFDHDYKTLRPILETARDHPIVVYCSGEDCEESQHLGAALSALGYPKVAIYKGGWEEWSESSAPTSQPASTESTDP